MEKLCDVKIAMKWHEKTEKKLSRDESLAV